VDHVGLLVTVLTRALSQGWAGGRLSWWWPRGGGTVIRDPPQLQVRLRRGLPRHRKQVGARVLL